MAKLSYVKFKAWHKRWLPNDTLTAEQRYKEIGGKIPKKKKD
jgi:hypothetical protein